MGLRLTEEEYQNIIMKRQNDQLRVFKEKTADVAIKNGQSLARGQAFEGLIVLQCKKYEKEGRAVIHKTPEPFLVLKRDKDGMFTGRFTKQKAQPDFQGTLSDGRSVIFEAKSTSKDRIMLSVITDTQNELLKKHADMNAVCGVLCEIGDRQFAVPYKIWMQAKEIVGHKHFTADELSGLGLEITSQPCDFLEKLKG